MKKIIAAVLALTLIVSIFVMDVYVHKDYKLDKKTGVLTVSGLLDERLVACYNKNVYVKSIVAAEGCELPENCIQLFYDVTSKIPNLESIDLSKADTSKVKNACNMFASNEDLKTLILTGMDTSNITNMCGMFRDCRLLEELDLSSFDTSNVTTMSGMFENCSSIEKLDLSGFNTANVIYMSDMFSGCEKLEKVDLSSFDTSKVESMDNMFSDCRRLQVVDISSFDTKKNVSVEEMFAFCNVLETIYVNSRWKTPKKNDRIFISCFKLVGGEGTRFDQNDQDYLYAKVDNGVDDPGYFTLKE